MLLLAVGSQSWLQQQAFRRGLLDYLNQSERQRLTPLAEHLAAEFAAIGSFERIRRQPWRWVSKVEEGIVIDEPPQTQRPAFPGRQEGRPQASPEGRTEGRRQGPPGGRPPPPPDARPERRGPPPVRDPRQRGADLDYPHRLSLLDRDRQLVIGPTPTAEAFLAPIESDGQVVGWLTLAPLTSATGAADREFVLSQAQGSLILALALLGLALALAWWMARRMLRRMATLADASRQWASGNYAVRADEQGKDELSALAADFNRMAEAQAEALQARNRWMADLSHELRTPVAILRGELQALQDGIRPLNRDALHSLLSETERLARRIAELQELARSESAGMQYRFHRVELAELLRNAVDSQRSAISDAGLQLSLNAPITCWMERGDPDRLDQLISNLLGNSRRYTDAPGRIDLALEPISGGRLRLTVQDSAPGIASENFERLFARHWRAEDTAARVDGSGLGLALCRNIVQAHGGSISAASSPLGGLRIEVELPGGSRR